MPFYIVCLCIFIHCKIFTNKLIENVLYMYIQAHKINNIPTKSYKNYTARVYHPRVRLDTE